MGSLKDLWIRTLELEPTSFTARVQLAKPYATVPGIMGGSTAEAKELEAAARSSQPETARIIRVHFAGEAKQWAEMETEPLALKPTQDAAMLEEVHEATMQLAPTSCGTARIWPSSAELHRPSACRVHPVAP